MLGTIDQYWIKITLGLVVVSTPFFIAALQKKISWRFFISWTLTSVFATLTSLFLKRAMEKNLDEKKIFFISILVGSIFVALGAYLQTMKSYNIQRISWMFIIFGIIWVILSF